MEFKVGDRVEVYFGDDKCEGIIKVIRNNDSICEVSLDGYNTILVTSIDNISRFTKGKKKTTLEDLEQRIEKLESFFEDVVDMPKPSDIFRANKELPFQKPSLLTEDERVILRNLDKKWKWIARDENGGVYVFNDEPRRGRGLWCGEYGSLITFNHIFQFIKWVDKPYNIEKLLKGECGNE